MPTKESYKEVNNFSPMYGLDCEMCTTSAGSECTRVSIVNEKLEVVNLLCVSYFQFLTFILFDRICLSSVADCARHLGLTL